MKLYLDTSALTTILKLDDHEYQWNSGRTLARDLLKSIVTGKISRKLISCLVRVVLLVSELAQLS